MIFTAARCYWLLGGRRSPELSFKVVGYQAAGDPES